MSSMPTARGVGVVDLEKATENENMRYRSCGRRALQVRCSDQLWKFNDSNS